MINIRGAYAYDGDAVSDATGVDASYYVDKEGEFVEGGLTQQSGKDDADINVIVKRFGLGQDLPENLAMPQSGDFRGVSNFHEAMNLVRQSQEEFMTLPADLRYRFANDPGRLMEFIEDGSNRDEAIKLGLVPKPVEKTRDAVSAIDELAAKLTAKP